MESTRFATTTTTTTTSKPTLDVNGPRRGSTPTDTTNRMGTPLAITTTTTTTTTTTSSTPMANMECRSIKTDFSNHNAS